MKSRKSISYKKSRNLFKYTAQRVHKKNIVKSGRPRGGIRL